MFVFSGNVPTNLYAFLGPLLQAWIDRDMHDRFGLETTRYGLVSFVRGMAGKVVQVSPAGDYDVASLADFAQVYIPGSDMRM